MHTQNILSLNVDGLNSAIKQTRVLEYLHRKSISCALIQEIYLICGTGLRHLLVGYLFVTASSGTFLHMFWECPIVINLWTHVGLVLSSLLQVGCFAGPVLCLLDGDSGLFVSLIQKRMLFAGFTAAKRTIIQNWFTPHMCGKT